MRQRLEGRAAYLNGKRSDANPYPRGTEEYKQWREGWKDMAIQEALESD